MNKQLYYFILSGIIILSFSFYSSNFYPLLSSDDALNILMAHRYQLPRDFYCWGQDRGGTLIPFISQIFIRIFQTSALTAVSLSNYLILILGFIGFSSLFKTRAFKLIFALVWFLPFQMYVDLLRYPIGVEYSLIGFGIFLINKIDEAHSWRKHLIALSVILVFSFSVWVSDLAIVTLAILFFCLCLFKLINKQKFSAFEISYIVVGCLFCYGVITFAKSFATAETGFTGINSLSEILMAVRILTSRFLSIFSFSSGELFVGIYFYTLLISLYVLLGFMIKSRINFDFFKNKWLLFFALDTFVIIGVLLLSNWVLLNGMGRWYFVATYISLSLFLLILAEQLVNRFSNAGFLKYMALTLVLIGSISPIYSMKYECPRRLTPKVRFIKEFEQLGEIGVIAEFWNAYILSVTNPDKIKATPHEHNDVRNIEIAKEVMERENIYVVKDMWFDRFPDTLQQFGIILKKAGNPFQMGNCDVCRYKRL